MYVDGMQVPVQTPQMVARIGPAALPRDIVRLIRGGFIWTIGLGRRVDWFDFKMVQWSVRSSNLSLSLSMTIISWRHDAKSMTHRSRPDLVYL